MLKRRWGKELLYSTPSILSIFVLHIRLLTRIKMLTLKDNSRHYQPVFGPVVQLVRTPRS